ncbi:competence protein CoiA [Lysinibacillus sp. 54212]|uniref:competence protein CoiA n=1 Tax=Lysinibacillus sp. 54212 TaxID=3119829 RepID=UPI002FCBE49B
MLVALTKQHEVFMLTPRITEAALKQLRKTTVFYCPQCQEPLQLKIGAIKIPHFAHQKNSSCDTNFSEGESYEHILGKQQLYTQLSQLGLEVKLEAYLPQLRQRPDLLVSKNNKNYALEFQCSPISPEMLQMRNDGYRSKQILPIWLVKTPKLKLNSSGIAKISLNEQHKQFFETVKEQTYLISYDSESKKFYYLGHLLYVQGNIYIANIKTLSLEKQQFPFYVPKPIPIHEFSQMLSFYHRHCKQFFNTKLFYSRQGVHDLFLRALYELRLSREEIPYFIGIPIKGRESISLFSAEWQLALFYFLQENDLSMKNVNDSAIHYYLKWVKIEETVKTFDAVKRYIGLMQKLNIQSIHCSYNKTELIHLLYGEYIAILRKN